MRSSSPTGARSRSRPCYPFRCTRRRRRQRPASIHDLRPADKMTLFQIKPVRSAADLEATVQLFSAYASGVGVDLGYQDFATELATLPGEYATPAGELVLARDRRGKPLGCVGLRPIKPHGCCEMKRLYVSPQARGLGLGRALIAAEEAVRIGTTKCSQILCRPWPRRSPFTRRRGSYR